MPAWAQALKKTPVSTVPLWRWFWRMAQYCWKVRVPSMEGWFVRVLSYSRYTEPACVIWPRAWAEEPGLYSPLATGQQSYMCHKDSLDHSLGLDDVVLDERATSPAVDGQILRHPVSSPNPITVFLYKPPTLLPLLVGFHCAL